MVQSRFLVVLYALLMVCVIFPSRSLRMQPGIIIAGTGAWNLPGQNNLLQIVKRLKTGCGSLVVEPAYVDIPLVRLVKCEADFDNASFSSRFPSLLSAYQQCLAQGVTHVVCHPYLLAHELGDDLNHVVREAAFSSSIDKKSDENAAKGGANSNSVLQFICNAFDAAAISCSGSETLPVVVEKKWHMGQTITELDAATAVLLGPSLIYPPQATLQTSIPSNDGLSLNGKSISGFASSIQQLITSTHNKKVISPTSVQISTSNLHIGASKNINVNHNINSDPNGAINRDTSVDSEKSSVDDLNSYSNAKGYMKRAGQNLVSSFTTFAVDSSNNDHNAVLLLEHIQTRNIKWKYLDLNSRRQLEELLKQRLLSSLWHGNTTDGYQVISYMGGMRVDVRDISSDMMQALTDTFLLVLRHIPSGLCVSNVLSAMGKLVGFNLSVHMSPTQVKQFRSSLIILCPRVRYRNIWKIFFALSSIGVNWQKLDVNFRKCLEGLVVKLAESLILSYRTHRQLKVANTSTSIQQEIIKGTTKESYIENIKGEDIDNLPPGDDSNGEDTPEYIENSILDADSLFLVKAHHLSVLIESLGVLSVTLDSIDSSTQRALLQISAVGFYLIKQKINEFGKKTLKTFGGVSDENQDVFPKARHTTVGAYVDSSGGAADLIKALQGLSNIGCKFYQLDKTVQNFLVVMTNKLCHQSIQMINDKIYVSTSSSVNSSSNLFRGAKLVPESSQNIRKFQTVAMQMTSGEAVQMLKALSAMGVRYEDVHRTLLVTRITGSSVSSWNKQSSAIDNTKSNTTAKNHSLTLSLLSPSAVADFVCALSASVDRSLSSLLRSEIHTESLFSGTSVHEAEDQILSANDEMYDKEQMKKESYQRFLKMIRRDGAIDVSIAEVRRVLPLMDPVDAARTLEALLHLQPVLRSNSNEFDDHDITAVDNATSEMEAGLSKNNEFLYQKIYPQLLQVHASQLRHEEGVDVVPSSQKNHHLDELKEDFDSFSSVDSTTQADGKQALVEAEILLAGYAVSAADSMQAALAAELLVNSFTGGLNVPNITKTPKLMFNEANIVKKKDHLNKDNHQYSYGTSGYHVNGVPSYKLVSAARPLLTQDIRNIFDRLQESEEGIKAASARRGSLPFAVDSQLLLIDDQKTQTWKRLYEVLMCYSLSELQIFVRIFSHLWNERNYDAVMDFSNVMLPTATARRGEPIKRTNYHEKKTIPSRKQKLTSATTSKNILQTSGTITDNSPQTNVQWIRKTVELALTSKIYKQFLIQGLQAEELQQKQNEFNSNFEEQNINNDQPEYFDIESSNDENVKENPISAAMSKTNKKTLPSSICADPLSVIETYTELGETWCSLARSTQLVLLHILNSCIADDTVFLSESRRHRYDESENKNNNLASFVPEDTNNTTQPTSEDHQRRIFSLLAQLQLPLLSSVTTSIREHRNDPSLLHVYYENNVSEQGEESDIKDTLGMLTPAWFVDKIIPAMLISTAHQRNMSAELNTTSARLYPIMNISSYTSLLSGLSLLGYHLNSNSSLTSAVKTHSKASSVGEESTMPMQAISSLLSYTEVVVLDMDTLLRKQTSHRDISSDGRLFVIEEILGSLLLAIQQLYSQLAMNQLLLIDKNICEEESDDVQKYFHSSLFDVLNKILRRYLTELHAVLSSDQSDAMESESISRNLQTTVYSTALTSASSPSSAMRFLSTVVLPIVTAIPGLRSALVDDQPSVASRAGIHDNIIGPEQGDILDEVMQVVLNHQQLLSMDDQMRIQPLIKNHMSMAVRSATSTNSDEDQQIDEALLIPRASRELELLAFSQMEREKKILKSDSASPPHEIKNDIQEDDLSRAPAPALHTVVIPHWKTLQDLKEIFPSIPPGAIPNTLWTCSQRGFTFAELQTSGVWQLCEQSIILHIDDWQTLSSTTGQTQSNHVRFGVLFNTLNKLRAPPGGYSYALRVAVLNAVASQLPDISPRLVSNVLFYVARLGWISQHREQLNHQRSASSSIAVAVDTFLTAGEDAFLRTCNTMRNGGELSNALWAAVRIGALNSSTLSIKKRNKRSKDMKGNNKNLKMDVVTSTENNAVGEVLEGDFVGNESKEETDLNRRNTCPADTIVSSPIDVVYSAIVSMQHVLNIRDVSTILGALRSAHVQWEGLPEIIQTIFLEKIETQVQDSDSVSFPLLVFSLGNIHLPWSALSLVTKIGIKTKFKELLPLCTSKQFYWVLVGLGSMNYRWEMVGELAQKTVREAIQVHLQVPILQSSIPPTSPINNASSFANNDNLVTPPTNSDNNNPPPSKDDAAVGHMNDGGGRVSDNDYGAPSKLAVLSILKAMGAFGIRWSHLRYPTNVKVERALKHILGTVRNNRSTRRGIFPTALPTTFSSEVNNGSLNSQQDNMAHISGDVKKRISIDSANAVEKIPIDEKSLLVLLVSLETIDARLVELQKSTASALIRALTKLTIARKVSLQATATAAVTASRSIWDQEMDFRAESQLLPLSDPLQENNKRYTPKKISINSPQRGSISMMGRVDKENKRISDANSQIKILQVEESAAEVFIDTVLQRLTALQFTVPAAVGRTSVSKPSYLSSPTTMYMNSKKTPRSVATVASTKAAFAQSVALASELLLLEASLFELRVAREERENEQPSPLSEGTDHHQEDDKSTTTSESGAVIPLSSVSSSRYTKTSLYDIDSTSSTASPGKVFPKLYQKLSSTNTYSEELSEFSIDQCVSNSENERNNKPSSSLVHLHRTCRALSLIGLNQWSILPESYRVKIRKVLLRASENIDQSFYAVFCPLAAQLRVNMGLGWNDLGAPLQAVVRLNMHTLYDVTLDDDSSSANERDIKNPPSNNSTSYLVGSEKNNTQEDILDVVLQIVQQTALSSRSTAPITKTSSSAPGDLADENTTDDGVQIESATLLTNDDVKKTITKKMWTSVYISPLNAANDQTSSSAAPVISEYQHLSNTSMSLTAVISSTNTKIEQKINHKNDATAEVVSEYNPITLKLVQSLSVALPTLNNDDFLRAVFLLGKRRFPRALLMSCPTLLPVLDSRLHQMLLAELSPGRLIAVTLSLSKLNLQLSTDLPQATPLLIQYQAETASSLDRRTFHSTLRALTGLGVQWDGLLEPQRRGIAAGIAKAAVVIYEEEQRKQKSDDEDGNHNESRQQRKSLKATSWRKNKVLGDGSEIAEDYSTTAEADDDHNRNTSGCYNEEDTSLLQASSNSSLSPSTSNGLLSSLPSSPEKEFNHKTAFSNTRTSMTNEFSSPSTAIQISRLLHTASAFGVACAGLREHIPIVLRYIVFRQFNAFNQRILATDNNPSLRNTKEETTASSKDPSKCSAGNGSNILCISLHNNAFNHNTFPVDLRNQKPLHGDAYAILDTICRLHAMGATCNLLGARACEVMEQAFDLATQTLVVSNPAAVEKNSIVDIQGRKHEDGSMLQLLNVARSSLDAILQDRSEMS